MASFELSGKLIEKYDVQQITDSFKKREFVVEVFKEISGNTYSDMIKFQITQDRVNIIDQLQVGNDVKVSFNIRGSKYTSKKDGTTGYITNLEAWRVESGAASSGASAASNAPAQEKTSQDIVSSGNEDDLPF